ERAHLGREARRVAGPRRERALHPLARRARERAQDGSVGAEVDLLERAQRAGGALLGRAGNARQRLVGEERVFDAGEAREERGPGRRRGQRGGERTLERLASATDEPGAQRGDAPGDPQPIRALVLLAARRVPHRAREEQRRADEAARVLRLADIDRALGERASEEPEA